ncbi:MAG: trypsin-like peptidase domain-containing protein [Planctomycetota bacterium]
MRLFLFLVLNLLPVVVWAQEPPSDDDLGQLQCRIRDAVRRVAPATVGVRTKKDGQGGRGSGVIVTADGLVMTAAHCMAKIGSKCWVVLPSGRVLAAVNLGKGKSSDAGLMQITAKGPWPFAPLGKSKDLARRQICLALGHPGGFSAGRAPVVRVGAVLGFRSDHGEFLRTTCVVRPGDSGGPLIDLDGKVIGIHSNISASLRENFQVPAEVYRRDWDRMLAGKFVKPRKAKGKNKKSAAPYLGLKCRNTANGCEVMEVAENSSAAAAGLRVKDLILTVDGVGVSDRRALRRRVRESRIGDLIRVRAQRGEFELKITIELRSKVVPKDKIEVESDGTVAENEVLNREELVGEAPDRKAERKIEAWLRDDHRLVDLFQSTAERVEAALCELSWKVQGKDRVASGLLVSGEGELLPKSSELASDDLLIRVKLKDGRESPAKVLARDAASDLCLLRVPLDEVSHLAPVRGRRFARLRVGDLLLSSSVQGGLEWGVLSVASPTIEGSAGGYLGIKFAKFDDYGTLISSLEDDSPLHGAGVGAGDAILAVNGQAVANVREAKAALQAFGPEKRLTLRIRRGVKEMDFEVLVGKPPVRAMGPGGSGGAAKTSRHRGPYPDAYLHDAIITPAGCVGPVTDLKGRFIGLNIARATRTDTVALTTTAVVRALARLRAKAARVLNSKRLRRHRSTP